LYDTVFVIWNRRNFFHMRHLDLILVAYFIENSRKHTVDFCSLLFDGTINLIVLPFFVQHRFRVWLSHFLHRLLGQELTQLILSLWTVYFYFFIVAKIRRWSVVTLLTTSLAWTLVQFQSWFVTLLIKGAHKIALRSCLPCGWHSSTSPIFNRILTSWCYEFAHIVALLLVELLSWSWNIEVLSLVSFWPMRCKSLGCRSHGWP
jgi:hypothetical protein